MKILLLVGAVLLVASTHASSEEFKNGKAALPLVNIDSQAENIEKKTPGQIFLETVEKQVRNPKLVIDTKQAVPPQIEDDSWLMEPTNQKLIGAHDGDMLVDKKEPLLKPIEPIFPQINMPPFVQSILNGGFLRSLGQQGQTIIRSQQQGFLNIDNNNNEQQPKRIISVLLLRRNPQDGASQQQMPSLQFLSHILPQLLSENFVAGDADHASKHRLLGSDDLDMNFAKQQQSRYIEEHSRFSQVKRCMMSSLMRLRRSAYYRSVMHLLIVSGLCFSILLMCMVCGRLCKRRRMLHATHNGLVVSTIDLDEADKKQNKMMQADNQFSNVSLLIQAPPSYEQMSRRDSQVETRSLPDYEQMAKA